AGHRQHCRDEHLSKQETHDENPFQPRDQRRWRHRPQTVRSRLVSYSPGLVNYFQTAYSLEFGPKRYTIGVVAPGCGLSGASDSYVTPQCSGGGPELTSSAKLRRNFLHKRSHFGSELGFLLDKLYRGNLG